ncbi:uncharacterized protein TRAVEDRAFT_29596 [Trametes versicolor FP-101664 SS1]|uniref:uncharacterized protein n=1 Tax=Trametes versicolor (strain FP-101664) TaxID=717944 RepID=UPI0004622316|nr:uncharacterized protein TRAVEDRAFT_29596 [Trametes versicolor FP-101664 SS1]EIW57532.1 hypothetical protein TRAVEDRAFT_29596 [Trametes versicolor FP-101664 SS1]
MKSLSTSLVSVALFVAATSAQLTLNTPNPPTQCVPVQITWTGGTGPFFLVSQICGYINPANQPGATALQQYPNLQSSPFTWSTNITANTAIGFTITDSTGAQGQTAPVTIQSGPDSSCLNGGSASSSAAGGSSTDSTGATSTAASTGATSTGATSGAATSGTATSAGSTSSGSKSASGSSTSSSTAAAATGSNGASGSAASVGVVGVLGALAAAFLA